MCPKEDNKGVKGLKGTAYEEQLKIFGLLSLERRARGDLVSWFRLLAGLKARRLAAAYSFLERGSKGMAYSCVRGSSNWTLTKKSSLRWSGSGTGSLGKQSQPQAIGCSRSSQTMLPDECLTLRLPCVQTGGLKTTTGSLPQLRRFWECRRTPADK